MFYKEEEIEDISKCQKCMKRYDVPINLPCGETICQTCINQYLENELDTNEQSFKCLLCDETHKVPVNGFRVNKPVMDLLKIKPKEVYRSELVEEFKKRLLLISSKQNCLLKDLSNKFEKIKDSFEIKRQHIKLVTESKIEEVCKCSKHLLQQLDLYEEEILKNLNENSQKEAEFIEIAEETDRFCADWNEFLKNPEIKEQDIKAANHKSKDISKLLDNKTLEAIHHIFNSTEVKFIENESTVTSKIIGELQVQRLKEKPLKNFKEICRPNYIENMVLNFSLLKNGHVFVAYLKNFKEASLRTDHSFKIKNKIYFDFLDSNGVLVNNFESDFKFYDVSSSLFDICSLENNNQIVYSYYCYKTKLQHFYIFNEQYKLSQQNSFINTDRLRRIDCNSTHIFVLIQEKNQIDLFNWNFIKAYQIKFECDISAFNKFAIRDDLVYFFDITQLVVFSKLDQIWIKTIKLEEAPLYPLNFTYNHLVFKHNNNIVYYDLNLNHYNSNQNSSSQNNTEKSKLVKSIDTKYTNLKVSVSNSNNNLIFYDSKIGKFYIESI